MPPVYFMPTFVQSSVRMSRPRLFLKPQAVPELSPFCFLLKDAPGSQTESRPPAHMDLLPILVSNLYGSCPYWYPAHMAYGSPIHMELLPIRSMQCIVARYAVHRCETVPRWRLVPVPIGMKLTWKLQASFSKYIQTKYTDRIYRSNQDSLHVNSFSSVSLLYGYPTDCKSFLLWT